jgi:hypothetical protein
MRGFIYFHSKFRSIINLGLEGSKKLKEKYRKLTNEASFHQEKSFISQKITKKEIYENNFQLSTFNFREWTNNLPINLEIGF